jgi:hypothetical protein
VYAIMQIGEVPHIGVTIPSSPKRLKAWPFHPMCHIQRVCALIYCVLSIPFTYGIRPLPNASGPELMQYSTRMPSVLPGYHHNAWKHHSHMVAILYCQAWRVEAAALRKRATYCQITEMPLENTELPRSDCRVCPTVLGPRSSTAGARQQEAEHISMSVRCSS